MKMRSHDINIKTKTNVNVIFFPQSNEIKQTAKNIENKLVIFVER